MTNRVEHNNSMLKSNMPCFKFIAIVIVAIVFNSFSVKGAQINFPVTADVSGLLNGPSNFFIKPTHYFANGFINERRITQTNGPLRLMTIGDSYMVGLGGPILDNFTLTYNSSIALGDVGVLGAPGSYGSFFSWARTNVGGATDVLDYNYWFAPLSLIPNGGAVGIYATNNGVATGFNANVVMVNYILENGAGTFKIRTNDVDCITGINANNGTPGVTNVAYAGITNSFVTNLRVEVVGTAGGSTRVLSIGAYREGTNGGITILGLAQGGQDLNQFCTSPTNIVGNVIRTWNPSVIYNKWNDGPTILTNNLARFNTIIKNYATNADIVWFNTHPSELPATDLTFRQMNLFAYTNATAQGYIYIDTYGLMGGVAGAYANGFLVSGNEHATVQGDLFTANNLFSLASLFGGDNKKVGRITLTASSPLGSDLTNTLFQTRSPSGGFGISFGYNTMYADGNMYIRAPGTYFGFNSSVFTPSETYGFSGSMGLYGGPLYLYSGAIAQVTINTNSYPASHTYWTQVTDGSCTNLPVSGTSMTNTWLGSGTSPNLRPVIEGFYGIIANRTIEGEGDGFYWTGATPGNCLIMVNMNTSTATNTVQKVLTTPPANVAGDFLRIKFKLTARTSTTINASGAIEFDNAGVTTRRAFTNALATTGLDFTSQFRIDVASTNGATTDGFVIRNMNIFWR